MSNWTPIVQNDLLAYCRSEIILTAQSQSVGGQDPVAEAITNAVAKVRSYVGTGGNSLDLNLANVPNCLKDLVIRMAVRVLYNRIPMPLTEEMRDDRREDEARILRIVGGRQTVEEPDNAAAATAEQQERGGDVDVVTSTPRWSYSRCALNGL